MAKPKSKKTEKKSAPKTEARKTAEVKETVVVEETVVTETPKSAPAAEAIQSCPNKPLKGFFARKYDVNENVLTIFKSPRVWGALLGELVGTMLFSMLLLTLGVQPLYIIFAAVCIYVVIVGVSGANLNPLVTVGLMATRRMSVIRGVLYILAQVLGAWLGLIVINAFRLGSETTAELPMMTEVAGETFWAVALVELMGAMIIAFCFARAMRYARKSPLTFALTVTSGITLAVILGIVVSQSFFMFTNSFIFNPAVALMYQILPTTADNFGELMGLAGMALAAYVLLPMIGGVLGFYLSELMTRLSGRAYFFGGCEETCPCAEDCACAKAAKK